MSDYQKSDFLEFVEDYERITSSTQRTAEGVRGACKSVLVDVPDNVLVSDWDVESILRHYFTNNDVTDQTKRSYRSRFKNAVIKFLAYKNGESVKAKPKRSASGSKAAQAEVITQTFEVPIPLRGDIVVAIGNLPYDLTEAEADRISNIINSYARKE
ncbi:hypothetical protein [Serratia marcescens]|uniref:hypothetical protein n=1 Tax=Serratia marcescens TaxID=615 RepID=UPI0009344183|nr:hypothetical protein [Serratia marcescens]